MFRKIALPLLLPAVLCLCGCETITGKVVLNGDGLAGVTVTLSGSGTVAAVTGEPGTFTLNAAGLAGGTYTVTPTLAGYSFDPESREIFFSGVSLTGVDFDAEFEGFFDRRYNEVSFPTTHNAMSNTQEGWVLPNQRYDITRQLQDGVRALMLDIYNWEGEVILCHGCGEWYGYLGGHKPLLDGLLEIKQFLDDHPAEIVTIIFESYVSREDAEAVFVEAGLLDYALVQAPGAPWPTLGEMAAAGTRLVVFTDSDGALGTWYHPVWSFAWETHWSAEFPEDFTCNPNRGSMASDLFILNHFLTRGTTPKSVLAQEVNHDPFLEDRAMECWDSSGRRPNFVTVDFYDIGDVFRTVNALNTP
jgi:hypothetical protein